jgi:hypothetical protein
VTRGRALALLLLAAVALATVAAPFASSAPDGLQAVTAAHGLAETAPVWSGAPLPGYGASRLARSAAGLLGALLVLGVGLGLGRVLARRPGD